MTSQTLALTGSQHSMKGAHHQVSVRYDAQRPPFLVDDDQASDVVNVHSLGGRQDRLGQFSRIDISHADFSD